MAPPETGPASNDHTPDLTPWGPEVGRKVQPVFSALFHDLMSPLAVLDSNLFLARKYLENLIEQGDLDEEAKVRLASVIEFIDLGRSAGKRVLAGLRIPRDAIWKSVLEGVSFDVQRVVEEIAEATRSPRRP